MDNLRTLAVCAGIGGLELGVSIATGGRSRVVGYIERDAYAAAVLLARMEDSSLEPAPIWCGDLAEFPVDSFVGQVDLVTAGDPCPAFSTAARGNNTAANLWPDVANVIRRIQPRFVFRENVAGTREHLRMVRNDLQAMGYRVPPPCVVRASDVGAPHRRERVFVLGYADRHGEPTFPLDEKTPRLRGLPQDGRYWSEPPDVLGMDDGAPARVDRLRCLGNAVVPQQAALAFKLLMGRI